jgi:predicted nucleic acid-binding protein
VSFYLDASILVAYFIADAFTNRARRFLYSELPQAIVSDFAATEFSSALGHRVRTKRITSGEAQTAFATFDAWAARAPNRIVTQPEDLTVATAILRRLDLNIRTADALNIAICDAARRDARHLRRQDGRQRPRPRRDGGCRLTTAPSSRRR